MSPTVARTVTITYGGEPRTLKFGLLAFKDMGLNPFDPVTSLEFLQRPLDLSLAAGLIRAGLLHEYHGKNATRKHEVPPTADDVLADMEELDEFVAAWKNVAQLFGEEEVNGNGKKPEVKAPADPPPA